MILVEPGDPRDPRAVALLEQSHALMEELFPPEENYHLSVEELTGAEVRFYHAREGQALLGTGALALKEGYAELKSMFTAPSARGRGVAAAILRALEDEARELKLSHLRLETGETLTDAIHFYERHGFDRCGPFGDYSENSTSLFMEKAL